MQKSTIRHCELNKYLKGGLEIVSIDTTDNRFQRNYILTGWEKRHYKVPSLTVYVNGKNTRRKKYL